jgi:periplasmic protein CpxP/Spy
MPCSTACRFHTRSFLGSSTFGTHLSGTFSTSQQQGVINGAEKESKMKSQIRRLVTITCITAATALGGQLALAQTSAPSQQSEVKRCDQQHKKGHRGRHHAMRMAKELGLSEQQQSQAKALYEEHRAANKEVFQKMRAERRQLRMLVHSGSSDEVAIRAQAAKVAQAEADLAVSKARMARKFIALLTPEQLSKYQGMTAKGEGKMRRPGCCDEMEGK